MKEKKHLTNLQTQTSGCSNHIQHSSQALPSVTKYSLPVSNRFLPLDNKYEPQEKNLGILPQRKYKNFKETRRDKTLYMNHHQGTKDNEEQSIPTIMNGVICVNDSETHGFKYNDTIHDRINILSKSINEKIGILLPYQINIELFLLVIVILKVMEAT